VTEPYGEQSLDQAIEISLEQVKRRAVRGVAVLAGRGFLLNAVSQGAWFLLYAFLEPAEIGVFFIVNAAVAFLIYFSDIGLAAALIQKKETPTEKDLKTTFTVQQALVLALLVGLWLWSPYLVRVYSLSNEGRWLLYALGASLFLSSLKSIPSVLLERRLEFGKFVLPEIVENLVYNIVVVYLAWRGLGVLSFAWAVVARGMVGVVVIYVLQPWTPGIAFSKKAVKGLLKFGLPYQANSLVSVVKDQGVTLILGGILSQAAIGYLGTAMKLSQLPLRLFMDNVTKVSFPAMARMQHERKELSRSVNKSILFICFMVFPMLIGMVVVLPNVIELVPKYQKWQPALVPLVVVSVNTLFAAVATQMTNMLMAIGRMKVTIKLTIMYTALTVLFVPGLALGYGVDGAAAGYALVGVSSVVAIWAGSRYVDFQVGESVLKPAMAAAAMGAAVVLGRELMAVSWLSTLGIIGVGGGIYLGLVYLVMGAEVLEDGKKIYKSALGR